MKIDILASIKKSFLFSFHKTLGANRALAIDQPIELSGEIGETMATLNNTTAFDNTIRMWASAVCLFFGIALGIGSPTTIIYYIALGGLYITSAFLFTKIFQKLRSPQLPIFLFILDASVISCLIFISGGSKSPFLFVYFLPILIQGFHRTWRTVLLNAIFGFVGYVVVLIFSLQKEHFGWAELSLRILLFAMPGLLVVIGTKLLLKKETYEQGVITRLRLLAKTSHALNMANQWDDLPKILGNIVCQLDAVFFTTKISWSRILLYQAANPFFLVIQDETVRDQGDKKVFSGRGCLALQMNKSYCANNIAEKNECMDGCSQGSKSNVCIPIADNSGDNHGILFMASRTENSFGPDEITCLQLIAKTIGLTMQRVKKMDDFQHSQEMNSHMMACFLESCRDMNGTYKAILDGFARLLPVENFTLFQWDPYRSLLNGVATTGARLNDDDAGLCMGQGIVGRTLETKTPAWTYDTTPHVGIEGAVSKSVLCLPLLTIRGEPLGVLRAQSMAGHKLFTVSEINQATTFAVRASLALENAIKNFSSKEISIIPTLQKEEAA